MSASRSSFKHQHQPPQTVELPPFLHHHNHHPRYVPLPHHPPPPPPPPNPSDFYHRHHLPPPPPPPPLPPPIPPSPHSYRPLPPPPPYNPLHSQFTYPKLRPIDDDLTIFSPRSPPRVFDRSPFVHDRPRLRIPEFDNSWPDPPRVPPENRLHHHRPFDSQIPVSPFPTSDAHRNDLQLSFRFREDFIDGFTPNRTEEFSWAPNHSPSSDLDRNYRHNRNHHYVSNSSGSSRSFAFGDSHVVSNSNPSIDFGSNLGNYESRYGFSISSDSDRFLSNKDEYRRWDHARELPDAPVLSENNEFDNSDGLRVVSSRRVPHIYDSGKFNYRGGREGNQEFLHSPRKKIIQKKSALLRIQYVKSHNRNRNDEQRFSSTRYDDSDSSTFRSRGPFVYSDNRIEEDREGSPVELDVSFKSNALVAKAIVASSSHGVESDRNFTPRNRKIRKLKTPEIDLLNPTLTKLSDGPVELNSSTYALDCPTISYRDSKQLGENVMDSGGGAACAIGTQPCSSGAIDTSGNSTLKESVSEKGGNSVGSDGTSSLRTRRKKKVVSPLSHVSRSQATEKNVEPVKADKSESSLPAASHPGEDDMHSEEKTVSAGMVLVCNVGLQSSPNEVTALLDRNKVDESKVSEKDGTDINSGGSHVCNTKRKRNSSTHLLGSSSPLKTTKVDEGTELADRSIDLHTVLNSDKSPVELQNGSTFTGIGQVGDISQQSCRNDPLALLQNGLVKGYLEAKLSVGGNVNTNLSSPEEIKIHEDHVNLYSTFYDVQNASSSGNELVRGKHKITVPDVDAVDAGSKFNEATGLPESVAVDAGSEATLLPESVEVEGIPSPLVEGNAIVGLSKAEGTNNREGVFDPYSFNHYATSTSGSDNFESKSQWKIPVSEICSLDDSSKESCPESTTVLPENAPTEGLTKARMSVGGNLHVGFGKGGTSNKRKDMDIQLDFSSPSTSDMPVNMVNIVYPIDTSFSCSDKDLNFAQEKVVVSGADNFDVGSQPCTDKDSIVHGPSRKYIKKRKVCVPVSPSPVLPETQEEPVSGGTFMFNVELPSNTDGDLMLSENRIVESNIDTVRSARFPACSESMSVLIGNTEARPSFEATSFVGEGFTDNVSKLKQESCCPSGLGVEQKEKDDLVMITMNHQIDILDMERGGRGEKEVAAKDVEEPGMLHIDTVQQRDPSETQAPDTAQRQPVTDMECESYLLVKDGLPSVSNTLPLYADGKGISTTKVRDETVEFVRDETVEFAPDKLSNMDSPEAQSIVTGSQMFNAKISLGQIPNEKSCEDVGEQDEKHVFEGLSSSYSLNTSLQTINKKSGHAVGNVHSVNAKFQTQEARKTTHGLNSTSGAINMRNNQLTSAVPRVFPGYSSSKKTAPSSHITKPRTWHRTGNLSASSHLAKNSYLNSVPPQGQSSRKIGKDQNAYIRKGNSIVRKPSSVAAAPKFAYALSSSIYRLNPTKIDDMKNRTGVKSSVDGRNTPSSLQTGLKATLERPKTPPLPCSTKLSHCTTFSSGNGAPSSLADLPSYDCTNTESDPLKLKEITDVSKPSEDAPNSSGTHENQTGQINNFESQSVQDDGNSESMKARKMVYVKKKSNQLVAASSSSDLSVLNVDKTEALPSDGYYKSRKNQLIRKSLEITQNFAMPDVSLNSEWKKAPRVIASSSSRRRSGKGLAKSYKPSKFSLVWTLRDAQSLKKENASLRQMLPHLFPWKRATHWRSLMHSSASISNNSSLSTISRELLLSRKRETVYTRSTRGFSLRISKVLSVGGSSLKWSKSIEKNSKRANEEATLAVAAVEKKKRERNGAGAVTTAGTKNRNHSSRERIFRVGSFRYKMDPTRRTLQRISDEELSDSVALQSGKDLEKSSVPKRLLIGNDEYVRIGNGNQLIRDPKKRTRILASEKVRWSLHTARLRLARKSKYCQFFTRFGKCIKDDGKCPYIHDPSKIAVCTKFLKGSCSDPNCKLTHKVIPERMQDCSYFLQGLCTNESCPYRHVNVKANASICEGFLRGYCADGNECRKKHSYVCPIFEATGICTQGSKCKLHHPKNRNKGKKRKPSSGEQKNSRGRYFGSRNRNIDVSSEYRTAVSEKHSAKDDDNVFYQEGRFSDYIDLGICDEEVGEINDPSSDQTTVFEGELTDILLDVDELIKPTYVVNRRMMTESLKTAGNVSVESSSR